MSKAHVALLAAATMAALALAGCAAGDEGGADALQAAKDAAASGDLVLYLNLTIDGQSYEFSTANPGMLPPLQPPGAPPPLEVSATIEASGVPDPGAGEVEWAIDWDDAVASNGSAAPTGSQANASADAPPGAVAASGALPGAASHVYQAAGRHDIVAALSMAGERIQSLSVPLVVAGNGTGAEIPPGTELGRQSLNETGQLPLGGPECGSPDAQQDFPWAFDAAFNGTPAQVSRVVLSLDTSGLAQRTALSFLDQNGTVLAEAEAAGADQALEAVGPFPPGAYTVRVVGCTTVDASFTLDGEATYVAAGASDP
jgi:hypothetical protein